MNFGSEVFIAPSGLDHAAALALERGLGAVIVGAHALERARSDLWVSTFHLNSRRDFIYLGVLSIGSVGFDDHEYTYHRTRIE